MVIDIVLWILVSICKICRKFKRDAGDGFRCSVARFGDGMGNKGHWGY
jgi:hypothetical protein